MFVSHWNRFIVLYIVLIGWNCTQYPPSIAITNREHNQATAVFVLEKKKKKKTPKSGEMHLAWGLI